MPGAKGCTVFPADNAWNRRVDALPVAADSAAIVNSIGPGRRCTPISAPACGTVGRSESRSPPSAPPSRRARCRSSTPTSPTGARIRSRRRVKIEGGPQQTATGMRSSSTATRCRLYELYALAPGRGRWTAGSGAIWDLRSNRLRPAGWTSADAAGLPILPGLARYDEVARGRIDHALRFTVRARGGRTCGLRVTWRRRRRIRPCRRWACGSAEAELRHRGASRRRRAIVLRALREYGMVVADNGSDLVRIGRARPALEQRRSPFARPCARIGVRGRRPGLDPALACSDDVTHPAQSRLDAVRCLTPDACVRERAHAIALLREDSSPRRR